VLDNRAAGERLSAFRDSGENHVISGVNLHKRAYFLNSGRKTKLAGEK